MAWEGGVRAGAALSRQDGGATGGLPAWVGAAVAWRGGVRAGAALGRQDGGATGGLPARTGAAVAWRAACARARRWAAKMAALQAASPPG
ncbi:MAG TPA: hypothetical protein VH599_09235 [Ktedonobacterales bacterium]